MTVSVKLQRVKDPIAKGYDYQTADGRFQVRRQSGGMPQLWWLLTDIKKTDTKGRPKTYECDTLRDAREYIADELEVEA